MAACWDLPGPSLSLGQRVNVVVQDWALQIFSRDFGMVTLIAARALGLESGFSWVFRFCGSRTQ